MSRRLATWTAVPETIRRVSKAYMTGVGPLSLPTSEDMFRVLGQVLHKKVVMK